MRKEPILAAAAAATFGIAADAVAAPVTYDIVWTSDGPSTGTAFVTFDDSLLVPGVPGNIDANDITDVADIDAFGATFSDVPGLGTVSFDLGDLASVWLKVDEAGQDVYAVSFNTPRIASEPYMFAAGGETSLKLADTEDFSSDTRLVEYTAEITRRTASVPEPGTLALLAAGAAGLPLLRRRRKAA